MWRSLKGKTVAGCLRCGREFEDPRPAVTNEDGINTEIATDEWCPDCNRIVMMVVFRQSSAYFDKKAIDPVRGGLDR